MKLAIWASFVLQFRVRNRAGGGGDVRSPGVLRCSRERTRSARAIPPRKITASEKFRMPGGAAVRRLTDESGREVLTGSGIFVAKFAETQRTQRGRWAAIKNAAHSWPSSCLRSWRAVPRAAAIVRRAPRQARLNADQQQMAQMHADGSWVPRQRSQTQLSVRPAACGGGLRRICVHQRHPLLICVESCLLWRRSLRPPREFRKSPQCARICQVSSAKKVLLTTGPWHCLGERC